MTSAILQNAFLPTQISSCTLWLDGADPNATGVPPASGSTVSTWRDKSSTANNFTGSATYTLDSVYNKYGLSFDGTNNYFIQANGSLYSITNTSYCIFTVHRFTTNGSPIVAYEVYRTYVPNPGSFFRQVNGAVQWITDLDPAGYITVTASGAANSGIGCINSLTTTTVNAYLNGTSVGSAAKGSSTNFTFAIGESQAGNNERLVGVIFEMIIYNTTLTTAQRQQVEGYLAQKWGLQTSLPSDHPYRYSAYFTNQAYVSTIVSPTVTNRFTNAAFLPTTIPGCQLWFDAADRTSMTFSGSTVTQWNDKSGNGRNATNGGYVAPTYSATAFNGGYAGLLFNGSSSMLNTAALLPTPVLSSNGTDTTIFIVFNSSGVPPSGGYGLYGLGSQANTYVTRTPWAVGGAGGGAIIDTTSATGSSRIVASFASAQNPAQLYSIFRSGASHYFYQFGSLTASNLSSSGTVGTTSQTFGIGGGIADTIFFNSYISEIVIYNIALTTAQRQQVEGYLAWKWGIVANLPSDHPYKKTSAVFATQPTTLAVLGANPYNNTLVFRYFNTMSIAGSVLWLDGKDTSPASMTLVGRTVKVWKDKSGNGYNATEGNASYPATSVGLGVLFPVTQTYFALSSPFASTHTVFIVATTSSASQIYLFGRPFPGGGPTILLNYTGVSLEYYDNSSSGRQTLATTPTSTFIASYIRTLNTSVVGRYNGSQSFTEAGPSSEASYLGWGSLGCSAPAYGNFYTGTMYEFIIYNASLTTSQSQQVEGYLAWKWGIQDNLPATHPYKTYPPPP